MADDKPETHNGDLANLPPALAQLLGERRWVVWRWELRHRKDGPRPNGSQSGRAVVPAHDPAQLAASNDPTTWGLYADAVAAVQRGDADGIGFMLLGSTVGAIDLDKCRDPATGGLAEWARALHNEAGGYNEVTVSGTGTRILGVAMGPRRQRRFNLDGGAGIEIFRDTERYVTISGAQFGECAVLPPLDAFIDALEQRLDARPKRANGHVATGRGDAFDFNTAAAQRPNYDELIRGGKPKGQRSEAFHSTVMHLAAQGLVVDEIVEKLAEHPDGIAEKYDGRLRTEVERSYAKWRHQRRESTTGEATAPAGAPWPEIRIIPGELPRIVNEAEDALLALGREIYQRGGMIVRPVLTPVKTFRDRDTEAWRILEVSRGHLAETLARAAQWIKYDGRSWIWSRRRRAQTG